MSDGHPALSGLLARLAAPTPAPGGGTACAIACGLAAALVEMTGGEDGGRARGRSLELAEEDPVAYGRVLEAYRAGGDGEEGAQRIARALSAAADPPLALAETAAEVAEAAADRVAGGRPSMRGDALAAVLLAEAATVAAARLVEIDLAGVRGDPRIARARACAERAWKAREAALATAVA